MAEFSNSYVFVLLALDLVLFVWAGGLLVLRHRKKRRQERLEEDAIQSAMEFRRLPYEPAKIIHKKYVDELCLDQKTGRKAYFVVDFVHDVSRARRRDVEETYDRIEFEQAFDILRDLETVKGPVRIVLHTFGGFSLASEMIAGALLNHARKNDTYVEAYVPYMAMSGGTMIALAADKIIMGKNAALGPVDTQYSGFSAKMYQKLLAKKNPSELMDKNFLVANEALLDWPFAIESALNVTNETHKKQGLDFIKTIAGEEHSPPLPHSFRIMPEVAVENGLNVSVGCPEIVYRIVDAKRQMMKDVPDPEAESRLLSKVSKRDLWNFAKPYFRRSAKAA